MKTKYIWASYRNWSFEVLEGLLDLENIECVAIVTTLDCTFDFTHFINKGIPVFRDDPKLVFQQQNQLMKLVNLEQPDCSFFYGWSWKIPNEYHREHLSVTLHPGWLPNDKGGSPLQNQIRMGRESTSANIMKIEESLDSGPIYSRETISLLGVIDDVWLRMISAGILLTRQFLLGFPESIKNHEVNGELGSYYSRVKPADSEIKLDKMSGQEIFNIVRAHNEQDPNSYVEKAFLYWQSYKFIILGCTLEKKHRAVRLEELNKESVFREILEINSDNCCLQLDSQDNLPIYVTRLRITT